MMASVSQAPLTTLLAALSGVVLAGCAAKGIEPAPNELALTRIAAHGVQIYECRSSAGSAPVWSFVAPEADLFDAQGRLIGRHGAGPFWQHEDGSRIVGVVRTRMDAPRAHAIPWLLLSARSQGTDGTFHRVSSVQRVNTVGGTAPTQGCDTATVGQLARIAYRAEYVMFVPRPGGMP